MSRSASWVTLDLSLFDANAPKSKINTIVDLAQAVENDYIGRQA
jgi:hypothetical protein